MDSGLVATILQVSVLMIVVLLYILQVSFLEVATQIGIVLLILLMVPQFRPLVKGELE